MCLKHEAVITVSAPRIVSNRDNGGATFWTKTDFSLKWPTTQLVPITAQRPFAHDYELRHYFFLNWKPEISSPSMTHTGPSKRLPHGWGLAGLKSATVQRSVWSKAWRTLGYVKSSRLQPALPRRPRALVVPTRRQQHLHHIHSVNETQHWWKNAPSLYHLFDTGLQSTGKL